jgi:hypothetical protein
MTEAWIVLGLIVGLAVAVLILTGRDRAGRWWRDGT